MGETVPGAEVTKSFELYQDRALRGPVTVTARGQALSIAELAEADMDAIALARIPEDKRYRTDDLKRSATGPVALWDGEPKRPSVHHDTIYDET
jgi:hypothetical protein